ncbi:MAG: hypothetical protein VXY41_06635, partial [Pseudomonadota bacterium]|nr:hypothetical protein [Pseudomonadota bacterium]
FGRGKAVGALIFSLIGLGGWSLLNAASNEAAQAGIGLTFLMLACLLGDRMQDGISLVYSFFDPRAAKRSLGSFMILDQIARAKEAGHAHIYLGYLIEDCRKMAYKKRFAPLQKLGQDGWEDYQPT